MIVCKCVSASVRMSVTYQGGGVIPKCTPLPHSLQRMWQGSAAMNPENMTSKPLNLQYGPSKTPRKGSNPHALEPRGRGSKHRITVCMKKLVNFEQQKHQKLNHS